MATISEIQQLYIAYFGRPADPAGLDYWVSTGISTKDFAAAMYAQPEFQQVNAGLSVSQQVNALYVNLFGREADVEGLTYWTQQINSGKLTLASIANDLIYAANNSTAPQSVIDKAALDNKTATALTYTSDVRESSVSFLAYNPTSTNPWVTGPQFASANAFLDTATATNAPDAAAVQASVNAMTAITPPGQTFTLTTSQLNYTGTTGNDTFLGTQTTFVAQDTIDGGAGTNDTLSLVDSGTTGWTLPAALVTGVETISLRNVNTATVTAATTAVKQVNTVTITGTVIVGDTTQFTFNGVQLNTAGSTGTTVTDAADAVVAAINSYASGTVVAVNSSGVITVTAGTAGVPFSLGGFSAKVAAGTVGAEQYATVLTTANVVGVAAITGIDSINASNFVGSTGFVADASTGAVLIDNLAATQSVTAKTNAAALTANYLATAASSTLNITNGTSTGAVAITGSGMTSATVTSSGGAQSSSSGTVNKISSLGLPATLTALTINAATSLTTGTITASALKTVTVGGLATTVSVSTIPASVTSFNASGLTAGGVTATLSATASTTFTGGAGVDTITTAATTATGQVVDAGAGTADVLVLASTNDVSTTAKAAQYLNFEVLRLAKATQGDLSIFGNGITALQLSALTSGSFSGITATQAGNITVRDNQATALTLTLANATGTSDLVSLDLKNSSSTASNVDIAGLSIIGVETLNLKGSTQSLTSSGTSDVAFGSGGATTLTAINVTGSANTTVSATNTALTLTLDASASTGTFGTSGSYIVGSTIKGSATKANAFVAGGTNADNGSTYIGGSANDSFGTTAALLVANGTGDTTLTGGTGTDTLTISDTGDVTMTDNNFTNVTGFELLTLSSTDVVSLTTGAAFNTAFATGVVITNATQVAAKAYTLAAGLSNSAITFSLTTGNDGTGAGDDISIITGSGNDIVTLSAGSFAGDGSAADLIVSTGAGSDTITVTTGTLDNSLNVAPVINGGAGQDFITTTHTNGTGAASVFFYTMAAGQSTTTASDNITGFKLGTSSLYADVLDFTNAQVTAYATTAATGVAGLSVAVATTTGLVTFSGTNAATASLADRVSAVQTVVSANQGDSALFTFAGNSYVFNNDTAGDSLVTLIGVTGTALGATATTTSLIGIV